MIYGTLCSGIESSTVAWKPLGWKAKWFSEIDMFPSEVLKYHYHSIPNLGDIYGDEKNYEPVELVFSGTPCQDFSVAGNRTGLDGERSILALRFLEIIKHLRPIWVVWENVVGCLSTNEGNDFGFFLGWLGELGYGIAYRVLDAQYFGVPQRRRRVFVVGYYGDWRPPVAVLFERHSLQKHPPPRITDYTNTTEEDIRKNGSRLYENHSQDKRIKEVNVSPTIAKKSGTGGGNLPIVTCYWDGKQVTNTLDASSMRKKQTMPGKQRFPACIDYDINHNLVARFLTPLECERLQGLPDNYTKIPFRKKLPEYCPKGLRYSAIGNSIAVPCLQWIGKRINMVNTLIYGSI